MPHLNYQHLRYFWAIAHEKSLTRAAARMNITQSAMSVQLQKLEQQLGHPLFERVGRRLNLTEAGRIALDYADAIFEVGEEFLSTLKGRGASSRQVVRIGAITTLSRNFQLAFLRPLFIRADVELIVRSGTVHELLAQLEAHMLDLVLANRPAQRNTRTLWHSHLLDQQPVSLVSRPQSNAPRFRFPEDLRTEPVLLPGVECDIRTGFDRALEVAGIRPIIIAEVDDMAMLRLMARESSGVTLVPPVVVRDELLTGTLVERCKIPELTESFYAISQNRRFPNPLVNHLLSDWARSSAKHD
jgi:LysR family transcriptional activator of nhaA